MFVRLIHVAENSSGYFILTNVQNDIIPLEEHSTMYLFSGWWTVWALRNILVHVLCMYLHIHTHIPRSRITGSLGLCWTSLAVFQNACTSLHSHHQSMRVSIVPHSHQHLTVFLHFSHSGGCVEESYYGLRFLSLRTNEVRQHSDVCCTS